MLKTHQISAALPVGPIDAANTKLTEAAAPRPTRARRTAETSSDIKSLKTILSERNEAKIQNQTLPEGEDAGKPNQCQEKSGETPRKRHLAASLEQSKVVGEDTGTGLGADRGRQREQQVEQLKDEKDEKDDEVEGKEKEGEFKAQLVWTNIILFVILHSSLPVGLYLIYTQRPWKTLAFSVLGMYLSGLGVTGGSHRLWSHRAYKAKWPVQMLLVALQTMAGQNSIYTWSRDHRVHHKFAETNADPHNIKRGFFFAHMGWLCCRKHPDVRARGQAIDMSDLEANPYVMFQHRHFWWMSLVFTVLVPTLIPVLCWRERFWTSFVFSFMVRYLITLHGTWLVNSAAHYYGHRPYDTQIEARESPYVIYNALGEGFHNYHHTFPYDYATSEFGRYLNITTAFIDLCALFGLVDGRRKVDEATIIKRRQRTGDLTPVELERKRLAAEKEAAARRIKSGQASKLHRIKRSDCIRELDEELTQQPHQQPLNGVIHELPYISGLTSMKYTM